MGVMKTNQGTNRTKRIGVPAAEEILGKEFKCLNHGFVRLVDYMGGDDRVVQAARVSYGKGTKTVSQDKDLIDYLYRNRHTSPFEHVLTEWHCKMPIFVARQWVRHRTARLNEVSGRYSVMKDEFYIPDVDEIRKQSKDNKQARGEELSLNEQEEVLDIFLQGQEKDSEDYHNLLDKGVAKELARINLPLSLYTEWYWNIDLHNLFHFLGLRMHSHAQKEIRVYANQMFEITKKLAPMSADAFQKYSLESLSLSNKDRQGIKRIFNGEDPQQVAEEIFINKVERREFLNKLEKF